MSNIAPLPNPDVTPDVEQHVRLEDERTGSWVLSGFLLLATLTVLYLARDLALPIVMALVLCLVFLPAVRGMKKLRFPEPLGAAVVVLGLLAAFLGGAYRLAEPASAWLHRAPQVLQEINIKILYITGSVQEVATATAQVQDMTKQMAGDGNEKKLQEVIVQGPSLTSAVLDAAREFSLTAISTLILLYFLLASGDMFLRKTIAAIPRFSDKKRAVDIAQKIEADVSTYLLTVTVINVVLGCVVTLAMYLLGVPNPLLWGVMAGLLNYIPYIGDIVSFSVLTIVGLLTFDELWRALSLPGVFYLLTAAEGYLITPLVVGRRLSLNPVVIVLSLLFWGWMWGVPGALLAVPIMVVLKTLCDRVESLQVVGEFLGE